MSNEEKITQNQECDCICKNKYFKLGLTVAISSFIGLYCAMSLFFAIHKPPMPPCPCAHNGFHRPAFEYQMKFDKDRGCKKDFKKFDKPKKDFKKEIEAQKEIDD